MLAIMIAACSSEEPPPTCQDALYAYHRAGCRYRDIETGIQLSLEQTMNACATYQALSGDSCAGALDEWLTCIGSATPEGGCSCRERQLRFLACIRVDD